VEDSYLGSGLLDEVPRMISYRLMIDYPIVVLVGLDEKDAMSAFSVRRGTYLRLTSFFSALVLCIFLPLMGLIRRQQRTGAELSGKVDTLIRAQQEIERYSDIVHNMQLGLYVYRLDNLEDDRSLRLILTNPVTSLQFGPKTADMIGKTIDEVFPDLRVKGLPKICADTVISGIPQSLGDFLHEGSKSEESWFSIKVFPLPDQCAGILFENITSRKKLEMQLSFLGYHDALTGLYNRAFFEEELRRIDQRQEGLAGLVMFDVDGLKLVNDTMGHACGDTLLSRAADVLGGLFRSHDLVARIGGDEFAVVLQNVTLEFMQDCCERLRASDIQVIMDGHPAPLSLSMGCALSSGPEEPMIEAFRTADNNMYRDKLHRKQSVRSAIVETLKGLLAARDFITEGHADRLQSLVRRMAETLKLTSSRISDLVLLAQFHDIGKVGIPDRILMKQGLLTPEEREEMKRHCEIGHRVALSSPELSPIADWILSHQEWWNGEGYPLGIAYDEIPLECRILSIADAYDAMTSDRPYRRAMESPLAVAELQRCAGTQFDPELVALFIKENVFGL
jgi:diguanylate cyclase (GGDEF)-like protein